MDEKNGDLSFTANNVSSLSLEQQHLHSKMRNLKILESLGVRNKSISKCEDIAKKLNTPAKKRMLKNASSQSSMPTRKSARLSGKEPMSPSENRATAELEKCPLNKDSNMADIPKKNRENSFGPIDDVPVGTMFDTRMEASHAGIHRPTVAGIHGSVELGCYSISLSGGYEDDIDIGDEFIFTGEGGRNLKGTKSNPKNLRTAAQSKDQVLTKGNLALSKNFENRRPVRVIRGFKLKSKYAPEFGYRYDGLYTVEEYYETTGLSGFKVYKFRMKRVPDQPPAPWHPDFVNNDEHSKLCEVSSAMCKDTEEELAEKATEDKNVHLEKDSNGKYLKSINLEGNVLSKLITYSEESIPDGTDNYSETKYTKSTEFERNKNVSKLNGAIDNFKKDISGSLENEDLNNISVESNRRD